MCAKFNTLQTESRTAAKELETRITTTSASKSKRLKTPPRLSKHSSSTSFQANDTAIEALRSETNKLYTETSCNFANTVMQVQRRVDNVHERVTSQGQKIEWALTMASRALNHLNIEKSDAKDTENKYEAWETKADDLNHEPTSVNVNNYHDADPLGDEPRAHQVD